MRDYPFIFVTNEIFQKIQNWRQKANFTARDECGKNLQRKNHWPSENPHQSGIYVLKRRGPPLNTLSPAGIIYLFKN